MIKLTQKQPNGRMALFVGLSFGNLDRFREQPLDTFIRIDGTELDLPIDVVIFSGETEAKMTEILIGGIGPDTKVTVDPKLKQ